MSTSTNILTPIGGLSFTYDLVIGDETPFALNHWNGAVVTGQHDESTGLVVTGKRRAGSVEGWKTREGALNYARSLQSIRWPGEDIYVVAERVYPEGDGDPFIAGWYVAGPIDSRVLAEWLDLL